jgi:phage-related protein
MAIGLVQSTGANIAGFSGPVVPDKNYKRNRKPNVRVTKFGDGYEQRKVIGINNTSEEYTLSFVNRPESEIDDLNTFFESLNGVDTFIFKEEDTNSSPITIDLIVVCDEWDISTPVSGVKSLTAKLRRVYEA